MSTQDFYQVLGVSKGADADQIKQAFRAKARKLHPDVSEDPDAGTKFSQLNEAYEVLSDPEKRSKYDQLGHERYSSGQPAGYARAQQVDYGDLGSIIDAMFGGSSGRASSGGGLGGFGGGARQAVKGQDIRVGLRVSLRDVHQGASKSISVPDGRGGYKHIDVKVPKGVKSGGKLRLRDQGMPSPMGGQQGDLYVTIHIDPDQRYTRIDDGLDLQIELPLSIAEATLGDKVEVPTIDGKIVTLTVPPTTASGSRFRINGHGLTGANGDVGRLFVKVKIIPPSGAELTQTLRDALVEMKTASRAESVTDSEAAPEG